MKKKWIALIGIAVLLLLLLAFCGRFREAPPEETTVPMTTTQPQTTTTPETEATTAPTETTVPETTQAPTEPVWEPGTIRAAYAEAIYDFLPVGTEIEVIGQVKDYYVIAGETCDLLIEKRFVRLEGEKPFEARKAYAKKGAEVFSSVYMRGEPATTLPRNTKLTFVESKDDWAFVKWNDGEGYMKVGRTSKSYISSPKPSTGNTETPTEPPKDGTDVDVGELATSQNEGTVALLGAYYGPEQEPDFEPCKGTVIADQVEVYLVLGLYDDTVKITSTDEEYSFIWIEGELYVKLPDWLVSNGTDKYESWKGYSKKGAVLYEEYQLRNEVKKLPRNAEIRILDKIPEKLYSYYHPGCYVVMVDGEVYYMTLDSAKATKYSSSSGNTGSGNSGSGNEDSGGNQNTTGDVWTPPAL